MGYGIKISISPGPRNDVTDHLVVSHAYCYSKEPKSLTACNLFTFFRADLIQSEASWKLSSTSDWLISVKKNELKVIAVSYVQPCFVKTISQSLMTVLTFLSVL